MILRGRPVVPRGVVVPRSLVVFCICGLVSLVAVGLGIAASLAGLVVLGLTSLGIVGLAGLVTVGLDNPGGLVVGLLVGVGLLSPIAGFAFLGLRSLVIGFSAGLALLAFLAHLGLLLAFAMGRVVIRAVGNAHNVNEAAWQSGSGLPQVRSLTWVRGLLPPDEGAAWWAEVNSTLAETVDSAQQRAYVRGYRRGLPHLLWTSWVLYLSSARRREVS